MKTAKSERLVAVNCTIRPEDLELATMMGATVVKGEPTTNTSLGFREVFNAVRKFGDALIIMRQIQKNPRQAKKLVDGFLGADTDS